ncbi:hypothetical protein ACTXT7_001816 [Hymenolepis weldensis]
MAMQQKLEYELDRKTIWAHIMSNCSTAPSHGGGIPNTGSIGGGNPGGRWPYDEDFRRSRRQLPHSPYHRPLTSVYQQPSPPSISDARPHAFETRPLPSVSLAEQGIAILQSWVKETKNRDSHFGIKRGADHVPSRFGGADFCRPSFCQLLKTIRGVQYLLYALFTFRNS